MKKMWLLAVVAAVLFLPVLQPVALAECSEPAALPTTGQSGVTNDNVSGAPRRLIMTLLGVLGVDEETTKMVGVILSAILIVKEAGSLCVNDVTQDPIVKILVGGLIGKIPCIGPIIVRSDIPQ